MSTYDFRDKVAIVTGGSRGIGRATALRLAACGADVAITYLRRQGAAEEVARSIEELGRKCLTVRADLGAPDDIRRIFDTVGSRWGYLDFYVNNAAAAFFKPLADLQPFHWDHVVGANLTATLLACNEAHRAMAGDEGSIVLVSSLGSRYHLDGYGALGACKAAIESLGRSLAVELAPLVNVNVVCGGLVETESAETVRKAQVPEAREALDRQLAGRTGRPDDLAKVIAFLCSQDARWIRGQTIVVDGGQTLTL
ncbi:MAG: SDR family oxidoreductase [Catenulispora sp.]|nr:SDR family oxidoreductase [Catenulispora sp.]